MRWDWLSAFLVTQAVEMPIYRYGLRVSWLSAFLASAITHPVVWFVFFSPDRDASYDEKLVAAELFAWSVEAAWFQVVLRRRRAWSFSLFANAASVAAGLLARALTGWP